MRAVVRTLIAGAALLASVMPAGAQEPEALRPCLPEDLPGVWDVVRLRASASWTVDRGHPDYYQHQRYVFGADGSARHLTSMMAIGRAEHELRMSEPATTRWSLDDGGWLTLGREDRPPDRSQCQVIGRQIVDSRNRVIATPGEVLLTHYANDVPVMRRQLMRHRTLQHPTPTP